MAPTFADTNTWKCTLLRISSVSTRLNQQRKRFIFPRFGNTSYLRAPCSLTAFRLFRVDRVESEEDFQLKTT